MRIDDALGRFQLQLKADGRSSHTARQYQRHVLLLSRWAAAEGLSGEVEDLGHEDLARFLASPAAQQRPDGRPKRTASVNALRTSLKCFFGYLHQAGYLPTNPGRLIRRAICGPPPPRALSEAEQDRLEAALAEAKTEAERRDRVLFSLLLRVGLRIGSALALRVEDVDLDAGELHLRQMKRDRQETAFLPEAVVELLQSHLEGRKPSELLFPGNGTAALTGRQVQRRLDLWLRRAGITRRVSPHGLRHSYASRLYGRTGDIALVKEALHHRSLASTLVYARAGRERLRRAIGA